MFNNYICALDIGSSKIAGLVAQIKRNNISNIFFEVNSSAGVKKGAVGDSVELVEHLSSLLKSLKLKSGINIKSVYANISGEDIITKHSFANIPLTERGNKVITRQDLENVTEQARILGSSLQEEIIHAIAYGYTIDSRENLLNPLGLYSHRLAVDLYLICVKLSSLQSLTHAINEAGLELKGLFLSGLATSEAVFNETSNNGTNILVDIGSDTTEALFFKDGLLQDLQILSVGGRDLTQGLSDALSINFNLAEEIKRSHGDICVDAIAPEGKEILIKKGDAYIPVKQELVFKTLKAAAWYICLAIKEAMHKKKINPLSINNFVVTGRTVLLEGFIEDLEEALCIPVKLARPTNNNLPLSLIGENSNLSGQKYLTYLTSLGILCQALKEKPVGAALVKRQIKNPIAKAINRVKEVYQEYF
ncbi:MAG TPA: cell division protein FtsA [Candidatus Omnitrophota bacterium]|nr:cell division protein FtsA [Candidatus Omnitrophota bacterium]